MCDRYNPLLSLLLVDASTNHSSSLLPDTAATEPQSTRMPIPLLLTATVDYVVSAVRARKTAAPARSRTYFIRAHSAFITILMMRGIYFPQNYNEQITEPASPVGVYEPSACRLMVPRFLVQRTAVPPAFVRSRRSLDTCVAYSGTRCFVPVTPGKVARRLLLSLSFLSPYNSSEIVVAGIICCTLYCVLDGPAM